jgi:hypothetical protein
LYLFAGVVVPALGIPEGRNGARDVVVVVVVASEPLGRVTHVIVFFVFTARSFLKRALVVLSVVGTLL